MTLHPPTTLWLGRIHVTPNLYNAKCDIGSKGKSLGCLWHSPFVSFISELNIFELRKEMNYWLEVAG
jgi:hypothetical protein